MTDHGLDLERPYRERDPLAMEDAREASREVARLRRRAEADLVKAVKTAAEKEHTYRKRISEEVVKAKVDHPATVALEVARGKVQKELVEYRVAEGMVKAAEQRIRGVEGERSLLKSLIDWSSTIANVLRQAGGMRHEEQPK